MERRPGQPKSPRGGSVTVSRWVGSASVPSAFGYVNVGVLLAVLEVAPGQLVLRTRPALMRLMFGIKNLTAAPDESVTIFPFRGRFQTGVEVRLAAHSSYYFWTSRASEILSCLAAAGFDVSADLQRKPR